MTAKFGTGPYGRTVYSAGAVIEVGGTMTIEVGFAAVLTDAMAVSGTMPIAVSFVPDRLNGDFILSGLMPVAVGFPAATLSAGPLWGQDALCAGQWGPDALCAAPGWGPDPDIPMSGPWAPSELCDG